MSRWLATALTAGTLFVAPTLACADETGAQSRPTRPSLEEGQRFELTVTLGGMFNIVTRLGADRSQGLLYSTPRLDLFLGIPLGVWFETGAAFWVGYSGSLEGDDSALIHRHGVQLGIRNGFLLNHVSVHAAVLHGFPTSMTIPGVGVQNQTGFAFGCFTFGGTTGYDWLFVGRNTLEVWNVGIYVGLTTT